MLVVLRAGALEDLLDLCVLSDWSLFMAFGKQKGWVGWTDGSINDLTVATVIGASL